MMSDETIDQLLTRSLPSRPEADRVSNLANRAIERAQELDRIAARQRENLAAHRKQLRFITTAAAILIGVLILIGSARLLQERVSVGDSEGSIAITQSTVASTSSYLLWLGGILFIGTLAGLVTQSAIAHERLSLML